MPRNCTADWLAQQLNCRRRNIYDIFKRPNIDAELLLRLCNIMNHDFFHDISALVGASSSEPHASAPATRLSSAQVSFLEIKPYVDALRAEVERKCGIALPWGPRAFDDLNDTLFHATGQEISVSTLKRLWGYIEPYRATRLSTLNILAEYVGFGSFHDFCRQLDARNNVESDFLGGESLSCDGLAPGTLVELRWHPDRRLLLRAEGPCEFTVIESRNAKVAAGASFSCGAIVAGHPLMADVVRAGSQGGPSSPYVCGVNHGVSWRLLPNGEAPNVEPVE